MRIIPVPQSVSPNEGVFALSAATTVDGNFPKLSSNLNDFLQRAFGFTLKDGGDIAFTIGETGLGDEGYVLNVAPDGIKVTAQSEKGLFYGVQTIKQLVIATLDKGKGTSKIPCVTVNDRPRFGYRGFMMDVCRHFFSVETVKSYIEVISSLKMNIFHFHLTEDQGWRFQSDKYPRLTEVGGYRRETMNDGTPHGGFFTKEQLKEIVAFAADRYVEVVPEFDMPGHMRAALAAYPELGCTGEAYEVATKFGIYFEILCGGKDKSYEFIKDILTEFAEVFPSKYVHLGGDEAVKTAWYKCPDCQNKMKELGLKNEEELQSHMTNYAVEVLKLLGKTAICWNEAANSGTLDKSVTIQYWSDAVGAPNVKREAEDGRNVLISKFTPYYLDYPYAMHSLKAAYKFEPVFKAVKGAPASVIGVEAPIWTEWVGDTDRLGKMVFPRLFAVAETGWAAVDNKDYEAFLRALPVAYSVAKTWGIAGEELKNCNPSPLRAAAILIKFSRRLTDPEMIKRSKLAQKEVKKMRSVRERETK